VYRLAVEGLWSQQFHAHAAGVGCTAPGGLTEVGPQPGLHLGGVTETGVVEAVEVQLERLALDDVGAFAGHGDMGDGHLGLAAQIEPRQLEGGPQVGPEEGRVTVDADLLALAKAWDREQQIGLVLVDVGRGLAELGLFGCVVHEVQLNSRSRSHLVAIHFSPAITGEPPCRVRVLGWGRS